MQSPKLVALFPAKLKDVKLLDERGNPLKSPVTIEHSLVACSSCGEDGWVGPKQRLIATFNGYPMICYLCIMRESRGAELTIQETNKSIEDVQRRFPV